MKLHIPAPHVLHHVLFTLSIVVFAAPGWGRAAESLLERDVLPILTKQCLGCHGGLRQKGGLDMRTIPAMLKGGKSGPAVKAGDLDASEMWTRIAAWLDAGMATLIRDLKLRGMLDDTLIVWMGEFGRSPGNGEGHFCNAWSTVWAGGGLKTGQVIGKTSETGMNAGATVVERPISAPDYIATLCLALGIDIHQEFNAPGNRPLPLVEKTAQPIKELLS